MSWISELARDIMDGSSRKDTKTYDSLFSNQVKEDALPTRNSKKYLLCQCIVI